MIQWTWHQLGISVDRLFGKRCTVEEIVVDLQQMALVGWVGTVLPVQQLMAGQPETIFKIIQYNLLSIIWSCTYMWTYLYVDIHSGLDHIIEVTY